MKVRIFAQRTFVVSVLLSFCGCGGSGSGNTSNGGGTSPPTTTEILYASNVFNSIFALSVDQTTGSLTQTANASPGGETVSNSVITITPSGSYLYAVNDTSAGINGYATNKSGSLSLISDSPFPILPAVQPSSSGVEAMAVDPTGRFLYAGSGAGFDGIASFSIDASSGALTATGGPFSTGIGTMPAGIAINPAGTFLYATDQEQSVWAFTIDSQSGTLTPVHGSPFTAGSQPVGLQVDPSGEFLYVALSNSNGIAAFSIDNASGALTTVLGSPFPTAPTQFTQTYQLTIHPSGKFLYAFNFNGNTLAAFTINSMTGALNTIPGSPFAINPNAEGDLIVDPSGQFLYLTIGSSLSSAFVIFDIDPTTGAPTPNSQSPVAGDQEPSGLAAARFQ
ncbi:MAG: beta-propeller fold lactonase family protein [Candidatus Sulfotelmatobacter sp.]